VVCQLLFRVDYVWNAVINLLRGSSRCKSRNLCTGMGFGGDLLFVGSFV